MKLVVSLSVTVCGCSLHMKRVCNSLINTAISGVVSASRARGRGAAVLEHPD